MAWIRAMGAPDNVLKIYDKGSWGVAYENPGSYAYPGISVNAAALNVDNIQLNSISNGIRAIGTTNVIDFTGKTLLKIRSKSTAANLVVNILPNKSDISNPIKTTTIPASADYVEYVIDVSAINGSYYVVLWTLTAGGQVSYVESVTLE